MEEKVYLPVLLNITGKKICMIGAGNACREKLFSLGQVGQKITVIAPEIHEDFFNKSWIHLIKRKYLKGDLKGFSIVYVGVNNLDLEKEIKFDALTEGAMVNFLNKTEYSDFISPSAIQRKNFSIFVSTFGKGPGATKQIRKEIELKLNLEELDHQAGEYIRSRKGDEINE